MRALLFVLILAVAHPVSSDALRVLYMAQAGYTPQSVEQRSREFTAKTGIEVSLRFDEYEAIYDSILNNRADYDVVLLDNIWTADLASRGLLQPLPTGIEAVVRGNIIPEIYNANTYAGKIWAVPFLANFQLLYTNMDLLRRAGYDRPPDTLEEMRQMAATAKAMGLIDYPIFDSLRAEEVLVCELVWLSGLDGDRWETEGGRFLVDRPELRRAVEYLVGLKRDGLLNPYSLEAGETFSAAVFIWGDALFSSNWTFVIGELERARLLPIAPVSFELGVSALPYFQELGASSTISGFQGLAVMSGSPRKNLAWEYIMFLSSPDFQRRHLEEFSVWTQVWSEPETLASDRYFTEKRRQVLGAKSRPVHPRYQEISRIIQRYVHQALSGSVGVDQAFSLMQAEIDRLGL